MLLENTYALGFFFTFQALMFTLVSFVLHAYFQGFGRRYVKLWAIAFASYSVHFYGSAIQQFFSFYPEASWFRLSVTVIEQSGLYLYLLFLTLGFFDCLKKLRVHSRVRNIFILATLGLSMVTSLSFAFEPFAAFSRFYVRESLADFVIAGVYLTIALLLANADKRFFSSKLLAFLCFTFSAKYLIVSFLSVVMLQEPEFYLINQISLYFNFMAGALISVSLLIWMQGAERNAAEVAINRAKYLGQHDMLTGTLNREQVIEKIPQTIATALKKGQKLAIYLIDIKRFKFINDTYGLKTGDLVLGKIARRLSDSILLPRIIGRISGDSFVFAIEINEDSQQDKAAQHLHDLICRPYVVNHQEIHLQASIGFCISPIDGQEAEDLLHKANLALYQAETKNIPSMKYTSGMQADGSHLPAAEKEIRRGLAQQEFVLYFQPQLNLLTNRIDGVEALVRWQHPEKGLLAPNQFLDDFDALGLNGELDSYVLNQACQIGADWYAKFKRRITIAVNVSAVEFQDPKLVAKIQALLLEYEIPPKYLELEITENVVITDMETAMDTIVVLQNMGIKVSIDDFGTGYSSLSYLRELPIDKIKIDRSFITEFATNDSDLTIVKSMVKLSHGLGKRVLAEGVESQEQLDLLRKIGCDAVQGYFINPPLPREKLASYLSRK